MKQQSAAHLAEWQVTQFIQNDEISMYEAVGQSALLAVAFFLFKRIDEFNGAAYENGPVVFSGILLVLQCFLANV